MSHINKLVTFISVYILAFKRFEGHERFYRTISQKKFHPNIAVVEYLGLNDKRGNYEDLRGVNPKYSTTSTGGNRYRLVELFMAG